MLNFPYISRQMENVLSPPNSSGRAEIILGPRQVGKTTLLNKLVEGKRHLILTGEDDDDLALLSDSKSYLKLLDQFPYIVIDEAQFVPGIGRIVKRMVDSSHATYNLWPFSLAELAEHTSWIEVKRSIHDRMIFGCLPAVVNEPRRAQQYLLDFADAVLYKDLFKLAEMRKPTELMKLVKYLAFNVGSEVKYGTVASELGIQNKTIERYIDLLESCFIVKVVPSLSRNPQSEIKLGKKIYFYDNGIRNAIIRDFSPLPASTDVGALWENLFFTERLKQHAFRCDGAEIFFWRTRQQHEVDFLEVHNGKVRAFECKSSNKSKTTSIRAFERAYPDTPVTIVTPENIDVIEEESLS